ncbi:reverse transcriptase domain-containing protein [Tanacetum coccineum]
MNTASASGTGSLPSNTIANPKGELKAITTRSGLVLDGPSVPMHPPFINLEEDERVEETLTDPKLAEYTIKVPPPLVQKAKPTSLKNYVVHKRDPLHPNIPYPSRMHQEKQQEKDEMLKSLLSNKEKLLELANTPLNENYSAVILKNLPEKLRDPRKFLISYGFSELKCKALADLVGRFTFLADFVIVDYESDPRVPLILGRPFLRTARALIDVHGEEMILRDVINPLSGNPTLISKPVTKSSSSPTLTSLEESELIWEEFEAYLASDSFPPGNDDPEMDSILEDSVDEGNFANPNNNLVDTILEMFSDEHTLDYSSPPLYDDVDDDLVELESSDFLPSPKCDSVFYEDFSEVDALPSTDNEDKVFNPGILIHENLFEITIRVTPEKNVKKTTNASLILEDFNPPLYELPFHKEVPGSEILLSFSSKNEEKVFNPGILTSKGVHTSLLPELSHRGPKAFKVIKIFESPMEIFPCSYGEDIRILDVPCLHFYPP